MTQIEVSACALPCCAKTDQEPTCPFIKPVPPPDLIANTTLHETPVLEVVATLTTEEMLIPLTHEDTQLLQPQIPKNAFCSTPQTLPAPPPLA